MREAELVKFDDVSANCTADRRVGLAFCQQLIRSVFSVAPTAVMYNTTFVHDSTADQADLDAASPCLLRRVDVVSTNRSCRRSDYETSATGTLRNSRLQCL